MNRRAFLRALPLLPIAAIPRATEVVGRPPIVRFHESVSMATMERVGRIVKEAWQTGRVLIHGPGVTVER